MEENYGEILRIERQGMISVIIPTYNRAHTIKKSIQSVLNQGDIILEVIVIDDKSDDMTSNIINEFSDKRILYYKSNIKMGACQARNKGIELSKGKYIAFHDSDDIWKINKIQKQIEFLENNEYDIVCSGYNQNIDGRIKYIGHEVDENRIYEDLLKENFIGTPTIIGKSECFKKFRFDKNMPRFQDWDLMLTMAQNYKIKFINEPLVDAYVQTNSITRSNINAIKAMNLIIEKNLKVLASNKYVLENHYRRMGVFALDCNEDYIEYFTKAFKTNKSFKSTIDYICSIFRLKIILNKIHKR